MGLRNDRTNRVNFGNGQVHYAGDEKECLAWIADPNNNCQGAFVEWLDFETGDWIHQKYRRNNASRHQSSRHASKRR